VPGCIEDEVSPVLSQQMSGAIDEATHFRLDPNVQSIALRTVLSPGHGDFLL
jgi:hypothetical protein